MENSLTLNSSFSDDKNNGLWKFISNDNHNIKGKANYNVKNTHKSNSNFFNELYIKYTSFKNEKDLDDFILSLCKSNKKILEKESKFI